MKKQLVMAGICALFTVSGALNAATPKIIYGEDDRYEVQDYPDAMFRDLAKSTAGMVRSSALRTESGSRIGNDLSDSLDSLRSLLGDAAIDRIVSDTDSVSGTESEDTEGFFTFNTSNTLRRSMGVCEKERFSNQVTLPRCSGFLVGEDTLVTAGHCVTSMSDCKNYSWVFGYEAGVSKIKKSDVYKCKAVIGRKQTLGIFATKDYAVIKLDRKVKDRQPLKFRKKGSIKKNTEIVVIGHPSGLPTKIADGAKVQKKRWNFFYANLDTYGGNSGSAVFNRKTGEVEGILIQGAKDYVMSSGGCYVSNRTSNSVDVSKEKVFKIRKVKEIQ
ncbi:MAG: trypsin-like peptidase domain-containing protein [Bacteriovoracaceae bacterium]|nr:trypsin-like peptidase domain-containing protein [Bacteriovoracaceae bacterium]